MFRQFAAATVLASYACVGAASAMTLQNGRVVEEGASPMSAIAATSLLSAVCEAAAGKTPAETAASLGLKASSAGADLSWVLAKGAQVWEVQTRDSNVMVYAYGPNGDKCGVLVGRPIPGAVAERVSADLLAIGGYAQVDASIMPGDVAFTRMFSQESGRYVDMLEYPARSNAPGVLKLELLSN